MRLLLLDPRELDLARRHLQAADGAVTAAYQRLLAEAEEALAIGPFSVMDKQGVPPSGDKHDYLSLGTYWWPDPHQPGGKPYVRRDGYRNPEGDLYDQTTIHLMAATVQTLALAWWFSGDGRFSRRAALLLRTWFLDSATRMNPHLRYGQFIPGRCEGRDIGIIDTEQVVSTIPDATALLLARDGSGWTDQDNRQLTAWFDAYLQWLRTSDLGRGEDKQYNNHGTAFDLQAAGLALFCGHDDIAHRQIGQVLPRRIATQIDPDGSQPYELARTRSLGYSVMNLALLMRLARLGEHVAVDLWHARTADGRGIEAALHYLAGELFQPDGWKRPQVVPFDYTSLLPLFRWAGRHYDRERFESYIRRLPELGPGVSMIDNRGHLLCPAPPQ